MSKLMTRGISLYYETPGNAVKPPVMLLTGLGGTVYPGVDVYVVRHG